MNNDKKELNLIDKVSHIEWKPIKINGIKTNYDVSNSGLVRNSKSLKLLSPAKVTANDFLQVTLMIDKVRYTRKIHELVARAFLPNPKERNKVRHIDGNRRNNNVDNLEWAGLLKGRSFDSIWGTSISEGEDSPRSIYTAEQIVGVCALLQEGELSNIEISKITRVPVQTISNIKHRRSWRIISDNYYFPSRNR